jgi:hypothetical protein
MQSHNKRVSPRRQPKLRHLAGAAVGAMGVLLAGCAGTAESAAPTTTTKTPPPRPVAVSALDGLLVPASDINTTMGASAMQVTWSGSRLINSGSKVDEPECVSAISAGQRPLYDGNGWIASRGQNLNDEPRDHNVGEFVVSFPTAEAAKAFVAHAERQWSACAGRQVTSSKPDGRKVVWMLGEVSATDGYLTMSNVVEGGDGWAAQRVLTVRNNVVIDISVAGYSVTNQAVDIARDIAAKVSEA